MNPSVTESRRPWEKFSQYRVNEPDIASMQSPPEKPWEKFAQYRISNPDKVSNPVDQQKEEPTALEETGRHAARTGSRILETLAGFPADVKEALTNAVLSAYENFDFSKISPVTGVLGAIGGEKKRETPEVVKSVLESPLTGIGPTSAKLKEFSEEKTKGFTAPQSENEKISDELFSDAASLMIPVKGRIPFLKSLGIATGSQAAKQATKAFVGDEAGEYAKMGTMFFTSLMGKNGYKGAEKHVKSLYQEASSLLPENAKTDATSLVKNLSKLRDKMSKGTLAPSEKFVVDEVDAILSKVKNGKISPEEVWASKRSLNEKLTNILYTNPDKAAKAGARKFSESINHELKKTLEQYGKQNPKFYNAFQGADEAFGAIAKSKGVSKFIKKHAKVYAPHSAAGLVATALYSPWTAASAAATGTAGLGGLKTVELFVRMAKSPTLRKYYLDVIKDASRQDAIAMNKSFQRLNEAAKKDPEFTSYLKTLPTMEHQ